MLSAIDGGALMIIRCIKNCLVYLLRLLSSVYPFFTGLIIAMPPLTVKQMHCSQDSFRLVPYVSMYMEVQS